MACGILLDWAGEKGTAALAIRRGVLRKLGCHVFAGALSQGRSAMQHGGVVYTNIRRLSLRLALRVSVSSMSL